MQAIDNKIKSRIYGHGRGWAFSKIDFMAEFAEPNIHKALSSLEKTDKIRRVCRGIYDYPAYSELLEQTLSPDMDQVAHALARKFNWHILPSGDAALNLLGLSTQVPGKWVYLSDGPKREYEIARQTLQFRKTALKDTRFKFRMSGLLVQALKALGKEHMDKKIIEVLSTQLDNKDCERIIRDTRTVTAWIHKAIKQICEEVR
ncbi:MAG: DUF6088 family protein [Thiohalomonadales bacterium]